MAKLICKQCNKKFEHIDKRQKFCSRECFSLYRKKPENNPNWKGGGLKITCEECGTEFIIENNQLKLGKHSGRFCCKDCFRFYQQKNKMPTVQKTISKSTLKFMIKNAKRSYEANISWNNRFGYTLYEFMEYIESKFKKGMSWNNYGEWEIDHINPLCKFNFKDRKEDAFKECFALTNLQPLFKQENMNKGYKC